MREPWAPGFEDIIEASVARVMVLDHQGRGLIVLYPGEQACLRCDYVDLSDGSCDLHWFVVTDDSVQDRLALRTRQKTKLQWGESGK